MGCDYCNNTGKVVPFVGEAHDCPKCSILAMPHYKAVLNTVIIDKAKRVEVLDCIIFSGLTQDAIHSLAKLPLEDQFAAFQKHCNLEYGIRIPDASINDPDAVQDLLKGKISKDELNGMLTAMFAPEPPQVFCNERLPMFYKDGPAGNALNNFKIAVPGKLSEAQFENSLEATEIWTRLFANRPRKILACVNRALLDNSISEAAGLWVAKKPLSQQANALAFVLPGIDITVRFKDSSLRDTGIKDSGLPGHQKPDTPTISDIAALLRDAGNQTQDAKMQRRLYIMRMKLAGIDASMTGTGIVDRALGTYDPEITRKHLESLREMNRG